MCSPAVVLRSRWLVLAGRCAGASRCRRMVAGGRAAALGILASDLLAYSHDRVAPTARIEAIEQVGDHFAGQGLVLWNEFEEYAKYFARAAKISAPFEALTPAAGAAALADLLLRALLRPRRRAAARSSRAIRSSSRAARPRPAARPPTTGWSTRTRYYLGWRRTAKPRGARHLPLQQLYSPRCRWHVRALAAIVATAPRGTRADRRRERPRASGSNRNPIHTLRQAGPRIPYRPARSFTAGRRPRTKASSRSQRARRLSRVGARRFPARRCTYRSTGARRVGVGLEHARAVAAGGLACA